MRHYELIRNMYIPLVDFSPGFVDIGTRECEFFGPEGLRAYKVDEEYSEGVDGSYFSMRPTMKIVPKEDDFFYIKERRITVFDDFEMEPFNPLKDCGTLTENQLTRQMRSLIEEFTTSFQPRAIKKHVIPMVLHVEAKRGSEPLVVNEVFIINLEIYRADFLEKENDLMLSSTEYKLEVFRKTTHNDQIIHRIGSFETRFQGQVGLIKILNSAAGVIVDYGNKIYQKTQSKTIMTAVERLITGLEANDTYGGF